MQQIRLQKDGTQGCEGVRGMKLTLKGSSSSGWYSPPEGTHTGEKHRVIGSGKAGKGKPVTKKPVEKKPITARLVGKKAKKYHSGELTYYHAKAGEQLPKSVIDMAYGSIIYKPGAGIYATDVGIEAHYILTDAAGIPASDYDNWTRLWVLEYELGASYARAGTTQGVRAAERRVSAAAKALIASGFSPDASLEWLIEKGVNIVVKLGDA